MVRTQGQRLYELMFSKVMSFFHGDQELAHDAAVETWLAAARKNGSAFESEGALIGFCLWKVTKMAIDLKANAVQSPDATSSCKQLRKTRRTTESGSMLGMSSPRPWPGCRGSSGKRSNSLISRRARTVRSPSTSWGIRTLAMQDVNQSSDSVR